MEEPLRCPRCGGLSWFVFEHTDLIQKCLCGLHRYLRRDIDGMTVMHTAVPPREARLPAQDTKIYKCLLAVAKRWPATSLTQDVATCACLNGKETSALMAVLSARGLVERLEERRGLVGGSVWRLTNVAARLLHMKKE